MSENNYNHKNDYSHSHPELSDTVKEAIRLFSHDENLQILLKNKVKPAKAILRLIELYSNKNYYQSKPQSSPDVSV